MDRNWPIGRREMKQHLEDMSGTKNYITLSQDRRAIMGEEVQEPPTRAQPCEGGGKRTRF